jgi:hypothetical protein
MAQLNPDQYLLLSRSPTYGRSDGIYYDKTNTLLVLVINDTVVMSLSAAGAITAGALEAHDLEVASQARGDLLRRGASAWERVAAKTAGRVLCGDGTDVISAPITGDVGVAHSGGNLVSTVTDLTITNEARGDLLRRGAAAWERVCCKTAGQVLVGDGTDIVSCAVSGDAALSSAGALTLAANVLRHVEGTISAADIVSTDANKLGHAQGCPLLAAVGAGYAPELVSCVLVHDYDTAAYTDGGNLTVNLSGGGAAQSDPVAAANSLGAAGDRVVLLRPPTASAGVAMVDNAGLNLVAASAFTNPGDAAGVLRYALTYRVHATGL